MTDVLLLIIIGYLVYKEIRERGRFKGTIILEPQEKTRVDKYYKEISKEEFAKEKEEREQLQEEFDNLMSYKIDDAVNAYKRGDQ